MKMLLFALSLSAAFAQSPQATLTGSVRDAQEAAIIGAAVTAVNVGTAVHTTTRTNESGHYVINFLPVGEYELTVEQSGFRRYLRKEITLTTGQSLEVNVMLEVGTIT